MSNLVMSHKLLVVLTWAVLTVFGAKMAGQMTRRMDYTYATPGNVEDVSEA